MGALGGERVEILIEAVNRATATFEKVTDDLKKVKTQAKDTQQAFSGFGDLVSKAFGTYAVYQFAGAVKDATSAVLNWMGDMETYGIALASSLQVGGQYVEKISGRVLEGAEAFKVAQRDAKGVIEALQVANFQTVASLDQLIRMYQEALPIAMKKGFDKKMVQDFTLSVTQAASAMGISLDMMAEEARSLLTGAINMRNSRVAVALGITPEDVRANSASADQLFNFLMGKLQVYRQAGEALQNSWRGVWSNFKDVMMQAGGKALEPLFEGIKQSLKDIIDNIVTLDKEAGKIKWNPEFVAVLDNIKNGIINLMNIWTAFRESVENSTTFKILQLGWKAAGAVAGPIPEIVNNPGGYAQNWWEKTKAGLTSGSASTILTEGIIGIDNPWKKENVQKRDLGALQEQLSNVNAEQTIARNLTGLSDKERYQGMIWKLAKKYNVDPYEISSLIEGESSFKNTITTDKKGGVGALGLGQLRLGALKDIGLDTLSALDPAKNIEGTIQYYLKMKEQFGGDKDQARLAYKEGAGFLKQHWGPTPKDSWTEGEEIITDQDKYVRGSRYAENIQKREDEQRKQGIYGKETQAAFKPLTTMSEVEKETYQKQFEGHIAKLKRDEQQALDDAKQAGQEKKALDKVAEVNDESRIKNKEQRSQFELKVDQETTQKQLEIKQKYLTDYTAWTDQLNAINTTDESSLGVYKDAEEQTKANEKIKTEKSRTLRDISQLETDLVVKGADERRAVNDQVQKQREVEYGQRVKLAENEYNDLKKINELEVGAGRKTEVQSFDEENEARQRLIRTKLEDIAVQLQAQGLGDKEIALRQKQADLIDEIDKKDLTVGERRKKQFQDDQKAFKQKEQQIEAEIQYNAAIGDAEAIQALSIRLEISKLMAAAYAAEYEGQTALAQTYRDTAAAVEELNRGDDWFVGLKKGMNDLKTGAGALSERFATLFKGMVTGFTSSLGTMLGDWLKFDGNFMKDLDALKDYWKDFWGKMVTIFVQFLEELLAKWLASKIVGLFAEGFDFSFSSSGGGGGGGGGGGILGLLGKGKQAYDWYNKIASWWSGDGMSGALAANPSLGGDLAGVTGADMGVATQGIEGMSYGVGGGGAGVVGGGGVGGGLAAGEFGELGGAFYGAGGGGAGVVSGGGVGGGLAAGEFGELGGAFYGAAAAEGGAAGGAAGGGLAAGGAAGGAGASGTVSGALAATPALATAGFVVGAAYITYKIIEGVASMGMDMDKKAKNNIAGAYSTIAAIRGEGEEGKKFDEGKTFLYGKSQLSQTGEYTQSQIHKGSTDKEKTLFIVDEIKTMLGNQKDSKLSKEVVDNLITESLGPLNETLGASARAFIDLEDASILFNAGMKLPEKTINNLKTQFAGMNQKTIEAIPNLASYGAILKEMGIDFDSFNSKTIDAAVLTGDLQAAMKMLNDGTNTTNQAEFNGLLDEMRKALEGEGKSLLDLVPNLNDYWEILRQIGIAIDDLPESKNIDLTITQKDEVPKVKPEPPPKEDEPPADGSPSTAGLKFNLGFKYHKGGSLKYQPWGGAFGGDEIPIIAQKGEYVLSRDDVKFIDKIKGFGASQVVNIPPILPRVNVIVNNQSGTGVKSVGTVKVDNDEYIVDVLLKDLHSNGRLRQALGFR